MSEKVPFSKTEEEWLGEQRSSLAELKHMKLEMPEGHLGVERSEGSGKQESGAQERGLRGA